MVIIQEIYRDNLRIMIRYFFTTLLALTVFSSYAQDEQEKARRTVLLGFGAGYTSTSIKGPIVDHYAKRPTGRQDGRQAYNFSISLKCDINKWLFFESGLGYFPKGGYFKKSGYVDDIIMPVNYINIPVIIGLRPLNQGVLNFSGELGLSYDIRVGCNEPGCLNLDDTFQCCGPPPTTKDEVGVNFDIQNPIAVVGGASVDLNLSKGVQATGRFRYFDDINYFFGNKKDFSISGSGYSIEFITRFKIN
jgi:hypothetical protein